MNTSFYVRLSIVLNIILVIILVYSSGVLKPKRKNPEKYMEFKGAEVAPPDRKRPIQYSRDVLDRSFAEPTMIEKKMMDIDGSANVYKRVASKKKRHDDVRLRLKRDDYLELVQIPSKEFSESDFKRHLEIVPALKVYILVEFIEDINYRIIHRMSDYGFSVLSKNVEEYFNDDMGVFYGRYRTLGALSKSQMVSRVYLLKSYTARGHYKLRINPDASASDAVISLHVPYGKYGRKLLSRKPSFNGTTEVTKKREYQDRIELDMDLEENKAFTFLCGLRYQIDVEELLDNHIRISGTMTLDEYLASMQNRTYYNTFTNFSEKIVVSDYINSVVDRVNKPGHTLAMIWHNIQKILDKEIRYNWDKRHAFFAGQLPYDDIKDMYMTSAELSTQKVGACPERSSMETAILRKMGIAARTATRLYHMYTEIYLPDKGWVTTSAVVNEIPLCESLNEKQSYFVSWTPSMPIRLKWEGGLYPIVLY